MKKQKAAPPVAVETIPTVPPPSKLPVDIDGTVYDLCFDFSELAKAERLFSSQGHRVSLLLAFSQFTMEAMQEIFPCAAYCHHKLGFEEARGLVTLTSMQMIALAVAQALGASEPKPAAQ